MDALLKLSTVLGLSLTSGINLYATVAVVGMAVKHNLIEGLPVEFQAFNNDVIITVAIVLYVLEFIADKIPVFDSMWDSMHTFIRPAGAAFISLIAIGEAGATVEILTALISGFLALSTHTMKMGTRLVVNASPEPFSNSAISLGEDVAAIGLAYLSIAHPVPSIIIAFIIIVLIFMYGPAMWRGVFMTFKAMFVKSLTCVTFNKLEPPPLFLPPLIEEQVEEHLSGKEKITAAVKCYARKIKEAGGNRSGFLILTPSYLFFVYSGIFKKGLKLFNISELTKIKLEKRFLYEILHIRHREDHVRFFMLKNRTREVNQFTEDLKNLADKDSGGE